MYAKVSLAYFTFQEVRMLGIGDSARKEEREVFSKEKNEKKRLSVTKTNETFLEQNSFCSLVVRNEQCVLKKTQNSSL